MSAYLHQQILIRTCESSASLSHNGSASSVSLRGPIPRPSLIERRGLRRDRSKPRGQSIGLEPLTQCGRREVWEDNPQGLARGPSGRLAGRWAWRADLLVLALGRRRRRHRESSDKWQAWESSLPSSTRIVGSSAYDGPTRHTTGPCPGARRAERVSVEALLREVREETGFVVEAGSLIGVYAAPFNDGLVLFFECAVVSRDGWESRWRDRAGCLPAGRRFAERPVGENGGSYLGCVRQCARRRALVRGRIGHWWSPDYAAPPSTRAFSAGKRFYGVRLPPQIM